MQKCALLTLTLCLVYTTALAQRRPAAELPDGTAKALVEATCTSSCHRASTIMRSAGYDTPERWQEVMESMVVLPEAEAQAIAESGLRPKANPTAFWQVVAGFAYVAIGVALLELWS